MIKTSHALPKSIELSVFSTFSLCDGQVCATSIELSVSPKNFNKLFPSHMKSLFCTDKIESIEWQDLAPRQRTGDCLRMHIPH